MRPPARFALVPFVLASLPALCGARRAQLDFGLESVHLEFGLLSPAVGGRVFQGGGRLAGDSENVSIAATGAAAGFVRPRLLSAGPHLVVLAIPHLLFGAQVEVLYGGRDAAPVDAGKGPTFGDSLRGVQAGGSVGTAWSWDAFELRAVVELGFRRLDFDLTSLEPAPCKGGRCFPEAAADSLYLLPKVYAMARLGPCFTIGAFVGFDALPRPGYAAGAVLAFHPSPWERFTRARP